MLTKNQLLKIKLMAEGMKITEEAKRVMSNNGDLPLSLFEYATTDGVPLKFKSDDIFINAPFAENFCKKSKITLDFDGKEFFLKDEGNVTFVEPIPLPSYFNKKNEKGELYSWFAMTHTDRVRISPIAGCSFACKFCDSSLTFKYQKKDIKDLIESIEVAIKDPVLPAKHVLISGGTPFPQDYPYMDEVYEKVTKAFDIPVDIMMVPRPDIKYVDKLHSWGVHELSINLEIFNEKLSSDMIVGKYSVGRSHYVKFLERAVKVFGKNNVRSLLLVGLEPVKDTLGGIELLASIGVSPVLSPFRPSLKTPLKDFPPPSIETLKIAWEEGSKIAKKYDIKLGPRCIPCHHNTLSFSDKSNFYYYS